MEKKDLEKLCEVIAEAVAEQMQMQAKDVLTTREAAKFLGFSMSHLYKLTMSNQIPYYKPEGKICYFDKAELTAWMHRNRVATDEELQDKATTFCTK